MFEIGEKNLSMKRGVKQTSKQKGTLITIVSRE